jgi:hypothetical protein
MLELSCMSHMACLEKNLTQGVHPMLLFRLERSAFLIISGLIGKIVMPLCSS